MRRLSRLTLHLVFALISGTALASSSDAAETQLIPYQPCEFVKVAPCIESLSLIGPDNKVTKAIPVEPANNQQINFAGLSSPLITTYQWKTPEILHENKSDLLSLNVFHFPAEGSYCWTTADCDQGIDETIINLSGSTKGIPSAFVEFNGKNSDLLCGSLQNPMACLRSWGINKNYRYEVVLRPLDSFDFTYANGEGKNGQMSISKNSSGERTIKISSEPAELSYVISSELKPFDPNQNWADVTFSTLNIYIQTTKSKNSDWLARCNYGRGMSFWYSGQLQSYPFWVPEDSSLALQLSSTHFKSDLTLNQGTLNIEMPIETAKCLWKVDLSKSVSATLSALYSDQAMPQIITSTSNVDGAFFRVSSAGFHFSSPTLKLKLFENQSSSTPVPATRSKIIITCIKGKKVVKVSGFSPKCPKGYKKSN